MEFDLKRVAFSRYGAQLVFSRLNQDANRSEGIYMRKAQTGAGGMRELFLLEPVWKGNPIPYRAVATPSCLKLETKQGRVEIAFENNSTVRIRCRGVGLCFDHGKQIPGAFMRCERAGGGGYRIVASGNKYYFAPLSGELTASAPWGLLDVYGPGTKHHGYSFVRMLLTPDATTGEAELALHEYEVELHKPAGYKSFDTCIETAGDEFEKWYESMPAVPSEYADTTRLAAYICWSCVVGPKGNYTEPAMLMSNNWMCSVWNWDNYFNAWAMAYGQPELAWRMIRLFFDRQDETGALADSIEPTRISWGSTKPPIHGWIIKHILKDTDALSMSRLRKLYPRLVKWTNWWFDYRDDDGSGLPQYHHGNDSGWDNATTFDIGMPNKSPDLSAFLVVQMDALADFADKLGRKKEACAWRKRSDELLKRLIDKLWDGKRFVGRRVGDDAVSPEGDSLLSFMPILLGKRLPVEIRNILVKGLAHPERFLTKWGLATESTKSPLYLSKGYWRGCIWPPSTMIAVDGLYRAGEKALAKDIARRFCDLCQTHGFGENFDAKTGVVHFDPAYTWAASVFLVLAHEYL